MPRRIRRTNRKNSKRLNSKRRSKVANRRNTLKRRNTMKRRNTKYYKGRGGAADKAQIERDAAEQAQIERDAAEKAQKARGEKALIDELKRNREMIRYAKQGDNMTITLLLTAWVSNKTSDTRVNIIEKVKELAGSKVDLTKLNIDYDATTGNIYGFLSNEQALSIIQKLAVQSANKDTRSENPGKIWVSTRA